jgi:hypothetical protein
VLLALLLVATVDPEVERGVYLYASGDYALAVKSLEPALQRDLPDEERRRGRSFLFAGHFLLGDRARAREQATALLADDPSFHLDPALFPPDAVAFFEDVRGTMPPPRTTRARPRPPPPELLPSRPPLGLAFVPLGVGQFANGEPELGATFLAIQGALFVTSAIALGAFESMKTEGAFLQWGRFRERDLGAAEALRATYVTAFWAGVAAAAAGVVHAVAVRAQ